VPGSPGRPSPTPPPGDGVDHLVYTAPRLGDGVEAVERLLGVRPVPGGRHPGFGTHNALASLGPTTYLEIIAPDPGLPPPRRGVLFFDDEGEGSRLRTWAFRVEAIDHVAATMKAAGFDLADIGAGRRQAPDGTELTWRLTDPWAPRMEGALPFLIAWGDTPHPAEAAPRAGGLLRLTIEHPEPDGVRQALGLLGCEVDVKLAPRFRMVATIETTQGRVELH
jgi:hypothetical protein